MKTKLKYLAIQTEFNQRFFFGHYVDSVVMSWIFLFLTKVQHKIHFFDSVRNLLESVSPLYSVVTGNFLKSNGFDTELFGIQVNIS